MTPLLLLLALACSRAPEPAAPAPPPADPSTFTSADAPPVAEAEEEPLDDAARLQACKQLQTCGCMDQPDVQTCASNAAVTALPRTVYYCLSTLPCSALCEEGPGGRPLKGVPQCVDPWLRKQIGSTGAGTTKRVQTTRTVKKRNPDGEDEVVHQEVIE